MEGVRTLVANGSVGTESGLLVFRSLVLGQDGAGNVEARNHVGLRQLKAESLRVVVDVFNLSQLQRNKALVAASQGRLSGCFSLDGASSLGAIVVVSDTSQKSSASNKDTGVGSSLGGRLGCVTTSLLQTRFS